MSDLKNCLERPQGTGFCDMCASGRPDLCRYVNTVGALKEIDSLRAKLEEREKEIETWKESAEIDARISQRFADENARLREALATAESLLGEIQAGADQVNADLKRGREAEEGLEKARAALEHQRTALCIIRDRQLGRVSEEDLNQGIRQIDQTLSRLRESCPAKEGPSCE
jgi:chromosome segregation ATPase